MDAMTAAPLRSEAFAEDILDLIESPPAPARPSALRWLTTLAPLAVALTGLAFALVPPLA